MIPVSVIGVASTHGGHPALVVAVVVLPISLETPHHLS